MVRKTRRFTIAAVMAIAVSGAYGQNVISTHSGTIDYLEGQAYIGSKPLIWHSGLLLKMAENDVLQTTTGRAEIILTPGVFLRMGRNSAIRMVSNRLTNTQISVLKGSVLVECAELLKNNSVIFLVNGKQVPVQKKGLFRIDAEPSFVQVYDGEVNVQAMGYTVPVKRGRQLSLEGVQLVTQKFDKDADPDGLYAWSSGRAASFASANRSTARRLQQSGLMPTCDQTDWWWNSYYGMYTYLPCRGQYQSPFGYRFYSPRTVARSYPHPHNNNGWNGGSNSAYDSGSQSPSYSSNSGYTTADRSSASTYSAPAYSGGGGASSAPSRSDSGGSSSHGSGGGGHR